MGTEARLTGPSMMGRAYENGGPGLSGSGLGIEATAAPVGSPIVPRTLQQEKFVTRVDCAIYISVCVFDQLRGTERTSLSGQLSCARGDARDEVAARLKSATCRWTDRSDG